MAVKAGVAYIEVRGDFSSLDKQVRSQTSTTKSRFRTLGRVAASGFAVGFAGAAVATKKSVQAAVDLEEQINKTRVVFRGSEKDILRWSRTTSTSIGTSRREALAAAGSFGNMLVPMGIARERAGEMSKRMVQLAADMASFNNEDPTDMLDRLRAGLSGESEPLKRFGTVLSETRVQQHAWKVGIAETGEALTEEQKILGRYSLLLKDTKDQQGDFARTSGSLANLQRTLGAELDDVGAKLGKKLLPPLTDAAKFSAKFIEQMLRGKGAGGEFADAVGDLGGQAKEAASNLKPVLGSVVRFVKEHPEIAKAAVALGATALALKGIGRVGRATPLGSGISALTKAVTGAAVGYAAVAITRRGGILGKLAGGFLAPGSTPARPLFVKEVNPFGGKGGKIPPVIAGKGGGAGAVARAAGLRLLPVAGAAGAILAPLFLADALTKGGLKPKSVNPETGSPVVGGKTGATNTRARFQNNELAQSFKGIADRARDAARGMNVAQDRARGFGGAADRMADIARRGRQRVSDLREATRGFGGAADRAARQARTVGGNIERAGEQAKTGSGKVRGLRGEVDKLKSKKIQLSVGIAISGVDIQFGGGDEVKLDEGADGWGITGKVGKAVKRKILASLNANPGAVFGGMGTTSGGPINLMGANANMGIFAALGSRFGLGVVSGLRPGAITSSGNPSHHGTGRALDISGSASGMLSFAKVLAAVFGSRLAELIHTPMGFSIKNGARVAPYAQADHYDHVHVAMQKGGTAPMGRKVPGQGSGDKVPVAAMLEPGERFGVLNRNAARMWEAVNGAFPRFQRGISGSLKLSRSVYEAINRAMTESFGRWAQKNYGRGGKRLLAQVAAGEGGGSIDEGTAKTSSAGAYGPFQFIPSTRQAFIDRYGVDAWKNDFSAAKAAMIHLRSTGLAGYNPGMASYSSYILGQDVDTRPLIEKGGSGGGGGGGGGGGQEDDTPFNWATQGDEKRRVFVKGRKKSLLVDTQRFARLSRQGKVDWRRTGRKPGDRAARQMHKRRRNFHNRPDTIFGGFAEGFSQDFAMREALAALTPGTEDDLAIQKQAANTWAVLLANAQKAGAGKDVITTLAQNLKAAQDAIEQLTGAVDDERASRDAHTEALKEHSKLVKETQDLARTQGPSLASALAMFSAGYVGNRAAGGRQFPSYAGAGGVART